MKMTKSSVLLLRRQRHAVVCVPGSKYPLLFTPFWVYFKLAGKLWVKKWIYQVVNSEEGFYTIQGLPCTGRNPP